MVSIAHYGKPHKVLLERLRLTLPGVFSGVLLALSFPPSDVSWIAVVAFAPLFVGWMQLRHPADAFLMSYTAFAVWSIASLGWSLTHVMPVTALWSLPALLLLPVLPAGAFAAGTWVLVRRSRMEAFAVVVAGILVAESLAYVGPMPFPWLIAGHAAAELGVAPPLVRIGGVSLLSLWVLGSSLLVALSLVSAGGRLAVRLLAFAWIVSPLLLPASPGSPSRTVDALLVSPGDSPGRWADVRDSSRVSRLIVTSEAAIGTSRPDLVIWPETALPVPADNAEREAMHERLRDWARTGGFTLITGAITRDADGRFGNEALSFGVAETSAHRKVRLVPFAEYVPGSRWLPFLEVAAVPAGGVPGYRPGSRIEPLQTAAGPFGVMICLETLYGADARRLVGRGAEVLIGISQMGWWRSEAGRNQHEILSRLRAAETGRSFVYVSVDGTPFVALPDGSLLIANAEAGSASVRIGIPAFDIQTPFVATGPLAENIAWIVFIALLGMAWLRKREVRAAVKPDGTLVPSKRAEQSTPRIPA
jgi:apolipoprotein N-acyltransferase